MNAALWVSVLAGWLIVAGFIVPALVDAFIAEREESNGTVPSDEGPSLNAQGGAK